MFSKAFLKNYFENLKNLRDVSLGNFIDRQCKMGVKL